MSVDLESKIIAVASGWDLYDNTTVDDQLEKLQEEIIEFEEAIEIGTMAEAQMELGDVYVVMINIAHKMGYSLDRCGWMAFEKIKTRTGKMIDGKFIRDDK